MYKNEFERKVCENMLLEKSTLAEILAKKELDEEMKNNHLREEMFSFRYCNGFGDFCTQNVCDGCLFSMVPFEYLENTEDVKTFSVGDYVVTMTKKPKF